MNSPVSGAPADVGTGHGARDRSAIRGPSRVPAPSAALERIHTVVVEEHEDIARLVAGRIAALIEEKNASGDTAVLGLATGSTPIGVYRELIRLHREEGLSFANVVTFNLDEYYPMQPDNMHSYHRFMWENLFSHVDVKPENVHIPRGDVPREQVEEESRRYEGRLRRSRGAMRITSRSTAASTSRSSASARRGTSASTSRAPAPTAARAWCTWTP
jgi:glucosamine-6-phosphate deaminase